MAGADELLEQNCFELFWVPGEDIVDDVVLERPELMSC
jgi:hypothetical protein